MGLACALPHAGCCLLRRGHEMPLSLVMEFVCLLSGPEQLAATQMHSIQWTTADCGCCLAGGNLCREGRCSTRLFGSVGLNFGDQADTVFRASRLVAPECMCKVRQALLTEGRAKEAIGFAPMTALASA
jgi:hypothetical protein